jgi:hypothetical protein
MDSAQAIRTGRAMNFAVFKEPRGVMRILQFIFAICAFTTTTGFASYVELTLNDCEDTVKLDYSYPFRLDHVNHTGIHCNKSMPFRLIGDFSSDAQFFVATGVLSLLYCIAIILVYVMFDEMYQSTGLLPLADFFLTVTLAVFWLSGSAAWANGLNGLKGTTQGILHTTQCQHFCKGVLTGSFSELTISVILGFLNFFLWASDLWFLYKETPWFKLKQGAGVNAAT